MKLLALEERAIEWANARNLLEQTTAVAQADKTLEELAEAKAAIAALWQNTNDADLIRAVALELGDILVTLCLQAHRQGTTITDCLNTRFPLYSFPLIWDRADLWANGLRQSVEVREKSPWEPWDKLVVPCQINRLYWCVRDAAHIHCAMSPEECLALALDKIWNRQGAVVNGVFVKA